MMNITIGAQQKGHRNIQGKVIAALAAGALGIAALTGARSFAGPDATRTAKQPPVAINQTVPVEPGDFLSGCIVTGGNALCSV